MKVVALAIALLAVSGTAHSQCHALRPSPTKGKCAFDTAALSYVGSPLEQARCLLTPIRDNGTPGETLPQLPPPLNALPGSAVELTRAALRKYLAAKSIAEADIGGSLDLPLSRAHGNRPDAPIARYFVIHDTSAPNFGAARFPTNINEPSWVHNQLKARSEKVPNLAHIFNARTGESLVKNGFSVPFRSTCFEIRAVGAPAKGLFLGIENVQPRKTNPRGPRGNDMIAPDPGFTDAQLERLALLYVAASVRKGEWLIPAYHAIIDSFYEGGHDDPRNFDLPRWAGFIQKIIADVRSVP